MEQKLPNKSAQIEDINEAHDLALRTERQNKVYSLAEVFGSESFIRDIMHGLLKEYPEKTEASLEKSVKEMLLQLEYLLGEGKKNTINLNSFQRTFIADSLGGTESPCLMIGGPDGLYFDHQRLMTLTMWIKTVCTTELK